LEAYRETSHAKGAGPAITPSGLPVLAAGAAAKFPFEQVQRETADKMDAALARIDSETEGPTVVKTVVRPEESRPN
jgi:hypothetical protein